MSVAIAPLSPSLFSVRPLAKAAARVGSAVDRRDASTTLVAGRRDQRVPISLRLPSMHWKSAQSPRQEFDADRDRASPGVDSTWAPVLAWRSHAPRRTSRVVLLQSRPPMDASVSCRSWVSLPHATAGSTTHISRRDTFPLSAAAHSGSQAKTWSVSTTCCDKAASSQTKQGLLRSQQVAITSRPPRTTTTVVLMATTLTSLSERVFDLAITSMVVGAAHVVVCRSRWKYVLIERA